jgi:hypothetical protein
MEFGRSDELRIASTIRSLGETLHGSAEQVLAYEHDQSLKLIVTQVFVGELHRTSTLGICSRQRIKRPP